MYKSSKYLLRPLVANHQPAEGLQPTVAPLYYPSALIPSHLSPILVRRHRVVAPSRYDRLYASFHQKRTHCVAVITPVAYQPLRLSSRALAGLHPNIVERRLDEFDLRRGSLLQV